MFATLSKMETLIEVSPEQVAKLTVQRLKVAMLSKQFEFVHEELIAVLGYNHDATRAAGEIVNCCSDLRVELAQLTAAKGGEL